MIVQIYEVRTPEEAGALARLGVDHIGVLVGNGAFPRELTADRASAIFAALPARAKRVALSLSSDPAEIARVVEQTRPDIIHIGAAVELFSVRDTQALKTAFPDVRIMRAIPISTRRASNAPMTIGGSPTFCCSTVLAAAVSSFRGSHVQAAQDEFRNCPGQVHLQR